MRAKLLSLMSATGLGLLTLVGFQSAAQAHEVYRYRFFHFEHRDRDHGHRYFFHFRHYGDHDRR
jgi:hypothetical protein